MVDVIEAASLRLQIARAEPVERVVVDRALVAVAIDQIEQAAADALQCGHIERERAGGRIGRLDPEPPSAVVSMRGVDHAKAHRRCARPVQRGKACGVGSGLRVHEVINITLTVDSDRLRAMFGDGDKAHEPKEPMQLCRLWMGKLDEGKTVGAHRILRTDFCRRRVVRKWTHDKILLCRATRISRTGCKSCA